MVLQSALYPPPGVKCVKKFEDVVSAKGFDCRIESGFTWNIIRATPDANEIKSMYQSAACVTMFDTMRAVAPTECVASSGWYLYADLLNPILKGCESVPTPVTTGETPYNGSSSSTTITSAPAAAATPTPSLTAATVVMPTVAPVWVMPSPVATTATPVTDASTQFVNTALSRGTIIAILSASVVVLTTITGLVKFCYNRRKEKKGGAK